VNLALASWLLAYRREWLRADVIGGLTVAAVVIPKAMAYATIAGLPVASGLYTALAAMLVYPLFGSSRPLSVSTTSAIAMLTAATVAEVSARSTGAAAPAIAATLALLVGGFLVAARLLRLGFTANFISLPVLVGFEAGVGVVILIGQLNAVLGVHGTSHDTVGTVLELPSLVADANLPTLGLALVGIALLVAMPRYFPRVSAPLVWVSLGIAASALLGLAAAGVELVGAVPAGLPRASLPDLTLVPELWPSALAIALMAFTESVASARSFRAEEDPPVLPNQELLAVGAANLTASVLAGMPAGGGASQTAIAAGAGVRSQLGQWVGAVALMATLLFLSPWIALLPKAALAAMILVSAASMIKLDAFRAIGKVRRLELVWALATFAGVILIGTLEGILIAVALSLLMLMYQANHPSVYQLAYSRQKGIFRRAGEHAGDETIAGLLVLRSEGRLYFGNAANAAERMQALVSQSSPRVIVLECSAIPDIEYTALVLLAEAEQRLRTRGVSLWLAAVNPDLLKTIHRSPLGVALGHDRLFFDLNGALEAWLLSTDRGARAQDSLA
jgi:high affinity sulfate transporter 1